MKQEFRFLCVAVLFAVIALFLPSTAHSQITYRGFVETGAGFNSCLSYESHFAYTLSTTHGIQFNKNFLGVGSGIQTGLYIYEEYYDSTYYENVYTGIPIFLAYRYYMFNTAKFNFFGTVNLGCLFPICEENTNDGQLYGKIGGGLRQRISSRCGFSYGIHYYVSHSFECETTNMGVLLTIGLDF